MDFKDPVYVVYGVYATCNGDEIEHASVKAFGEYERAMDYGISLIDKFRVDDYIVKDCVV